jgi:signal transduction histidine kinase
MLAIIQETDGLSALLTEFRMLSKPMEKSAHTSWTALQELVLEVITPYRSSHPGVQFETEHIAPDIAVRIDRQRLSQVLTNVIINAIDAMDGSGLIELRADIVEKREISYCRLSVRDTGKGISAEEGRLIFTPYYTSKETGTGLGLPIVERIVNEYGGAIWFNSSPGAGATFFIDLPLAESALAQNDADSSSERDLWQ